MKLKRKIAAGFTALLLAAGGVALTAAPASAHTSKVTGVASCEADGTYTVEWTYNATKVPYGVEAETKAMTTNQGSLAPIDGVNKGGQIFLSVWSDHQVNVPGAPVKTGNWSAKFKTVGIPGNFVGDVTTMVQTDWKNGPSEDPVGKVKVDGTCKVPPPVLTEVVPVSPTVTAGTGSCVDGKWSETPSVLTFTDAPNGRYSVDGINYSPNPGPVNLTTSEITVSFRPAEGNFKLGATPEGWILNNGILQKTVTPIALTPENCNVTPPVTNQCVPGVGNTSTNLVPLWSNVDTRSAGHYEYVENGLHIWTDDNSSQAKVSLGQQVSFALKNTGVLDLDWTGSTPPPGINLFVNFGAYGNGTLVYESVYGQDLWLTNGSSAAVKANAPVNGGGNGSQWHGTIDQWLTKYPDAQVTGIAFSLGSGVKGDGVINSITANCAEYLFDYVEPAPKPEAQSEERTLTDVDCESKTVQLTYQERHTVEPTFDPATNTWSEPVWTEWDTVGVETRDATEEECPTPTPEPTTTPNPTPSTASTPAPPVTTYDGPLAFTGGAMNLAPFFWVIFGTIGAGIIALITAAVWRRKHPVTTESE